MSVIRCLFGPKVCLTVHGGSHGVVIRHCRCHQDATPGVRHPRLSASATKLFHRGRQCGNRLVLPQSAHGRNDASTTADPSHAHEDCPKIHCSPCGQETERAPELCCQKQNPMIFNRTMQHQDRRCLFALVLSRSCRQNLHHVSFAFSVFHPVISPNQAIHPLCICVYRWLRPNHS